MTPELDTLGATRAASPAWPTVIVPLFETPALGFLEAWSNVMPPAMKFSFLMSATVATSPLTSTCDPWLNAMPDGLTRTMMPLAFSVPAMTDGSAPTTRFRATELALGWTNWVVWPLSIEKLCQLIAARSVVWVTLTVLALGWEIVAAPPTTWPPVGFAWAVPVVPAKASPTPTSAVVVRSNTARPWGADWRSAAFPVRARFGR